MPTVRSLIWHTAYGDTHEIGDVYELTDEQADNLCALRFAARVEPEAAPPAKEQGTAVDVMTTEDLQS